MKKFVNDINPKEFLDYSKQIKKEYEDILFKERCLLLKRYKDFYKNDNIPKKFKTLDGINHNENGINLYDWYSSINYDEISIDNLLFLYKLDLIDDKGLKNWLYAYELMVNYKNHYLMNYKPKTNPYIPDTFKTRDGINYDKNGFDLTAWRNEQFKLLNSKNAGKILGVNKINLLLTVGINFVVDIDKKNLEDHEYNELVYLEIFKKYYKCVGNIDYVYSHAGYNMKNFNGEFCGDIRYGDSIDRLSLEDLRILKELGFTGFDSYEEDIFRQAEPITSDNSYRKKIERTNRAKLLLAGYKNNYLPSKEEINSDFMKELNGELVRKK